jgi:putative nucleotidyltransferase with HDIG domain
MVSFYRVKQFFWSLSIKLNLNELKYIDERLKVEEAEVFKKLAIGEQKHSIRVAIMVENICKEHIQRGNCSINKDRLVKAALLHDIGKIYKHLNVIDKSVLVILNKMTKGKLREYNNIKKIDIYYNHAEKGAQLLEKLNYDEAIIFLVRNHHSMIDGNIELDILKYSDSIN